MLRLALVLVSLAFPAVGLRHLPEGTHDIHLTHMRLVVDGATIRGRIRVFHDDTEAALRRFTGKPSLRIVDGTSQDSLFERYFDSRVQLSSGGRRLHGRVIESGRDADVTTAPMWWYVVEYRAPGPVTSVALRHELMFELFENQRNIVTVIRMPKEERYSLYFAAGDGKEQVLKFE